MAEEKRDFSKKASKERLKQLKGRKNKGRNARRILKYGTQSFFGYYFRYPYRYTRDVCNYG